MVSTLVTAARRSIEARRSVADGVTEGIELPLFTGDTSSFSGDTGGGLESSPRRGSLSRRYSFRGSLVPVLSIDEVAHRHQTNLQTGLTSAQVIQLLEQHGFNELETTVPPSFFWIWLKTLKDVILMVVMAAGFVNILALRDKVTGGTMLMMWAVASVVNAVGEWVSVDGGDALKGMSSAKALVRRDGQEKEVKSRDLVPGDVVLLKSGNTIPADMRLFSAVDLRVEESVLTGESNEISKTSEPLAKEGLDPFPKNMVYQSTCCVAGKGAGVVTRTGMLTQVGIIARNLDVGVGDLSPLQETMNGVGAMLSMGVVVVMVAIGLLCFLARYQDPAKPCAVADTTCFMWVSIAQGISLGLAIVPVSMPMMTTLLLYVARKQICSKQAIVRKTSTIETLGCCMAICSDKTGTLTEGKMTAVKVAVPRSEEIFRFAFYPTAGADPTGAIFKEGLLGQGEKCSIDRALESGSRKFPLQTYGGGLEDLDDRHVHTLLVAASLNSAGTKLEKQGDKWVTVGNLSEGALVVAAAKAGIGPSVPGLQLKNVETLYPPEPEAEVPFSSERKMMCTVHRTSDNCFGGLSVGSDITHVAIVKGAPDRLMPKASWSIAHDDRNSLICKSGFTEACRDRMLKENNSFADEALRVLLLCIRLLTADEFQHLRSLGDDIDQRASYLTQQLAVLGAFGIYDPPRSTVGPSIVKCKTAGIRVVMITGDQLATASAIGLKLGLIQKESEARLCADLYTGLGELRPEDVIDSMTAETNVWARAQPLDKVSVVASLQRMGLTTAMTGDGVNDAPALKNADIGTAMGITGTEVTVASADIVLMDDNFTTIVEAVQEGRRTYVNVQSYVTFYLAMSIPEVATYALCMCIGIALPITQLQVLIQSPLANFIPPLFYCKQPAPDYLMELPPRQKHRPIVSKLRMTWIVIPWSIIWCTMWMTLNTIGLWMHIGFVRSADIVGNGDVGASVACRWGTSIDDSKATQRDSEPYHCSCPVRAFPFSSPEVLEQWGVGIVEDAAKCGDDESSAAKLCISEARQERGYSKLGMVLGRYKTASYAYEGAEGKVMEQLDKCKIDDGRSRGEIWCWRENLSSKQKPLLDMDTNCGALGSNAAHTMSFLGTVIGKLLLVMTLSDEAPLLMTFHKNVGLSLCVLTCLALTFLSIYLPAILPFVRLPGTQPLPLGPLITTVVFALGAHLLLDIVKVYYRVHLRQDISLKKFHAEMIAKGGLTAQASDEEVEEKLSQHRKSIANSSRKDQGDSQIEDALQTLS